MCKVKFLCGSQSQQINHENRQNKNARLFLVHPLLDPDKRSNTSLIRCNLAIERIFNFGKKLADGRLLTYDLLFSGALIEVGNNYLLRYDKNYNKLRIFGKNEKSNLAMGLILDNERGIVKEIVRYDSKYAYSGALVIIEDLVALGILNKHIFMWFGISTYDLQLAKREIMVEKELENEIIRLSNESPGIAYLQSIHFAFNKKPYIVLQGQAVILDISNEDYDSLYTFDAGPCLLLCIIAKDRVGEIRKIGLAHIDALAQEDDIFAFMEPLTKFDLEFSVISGEKNRVLTVLRVLYELRYLNNIRYFDVDLLGDRNDAICLDKQGIIFYGSNHDWNRQTEIESLNKYVNKRLYIIYL
ncbi:MAG: hypothetical protein QW076_00225 [Candidatus Anstonellales archaeon]